MREQFRAYYSPTTIEFDQLWVEAVIVFDANALLNLFRYSADTRDEWLELLKKEKDRLWVPHQVALEFHRNRRLIAHQQEKAFAEVEKALVAAEASVRGAIDGLRRHPTLEADELSELIERHMKKVRKRFRKARARHFKAVLNQEAHEQTLDAISTLYESSVGAPYSDEALKALYKDGNERYAKKIPPGYMDEPEKKGDEKYGDLVLWRQILDYGAEVKKPLIFVTDDAKEDWWLKSSGKTLGPRPELVAEYFEAAGQRAHFYQPRAFLRFANERGEQISAEAIAEAKSVSTVRQFKDRRPSESILRMFGSMAHGQSALSALTQESLAERYAKWAPLETSADARAYATIWDYLNRSNPPSVLQALENEAHLRALYDAALKARFEQGSAESYLSSLETSEDEDESVGNSDEGATDAASES